MQARIRRGRPLLGRARRRQSITQASILTVEKTGLLAGVLGVGLSVEHAGVQAGGQGGRQ